MCVWALAIVMAAVGCKSTSQSQRAPLPTASMPSASLPANLPSTKIDYVDTDGFDALFEASLVNRDAVITIRTPNEKPDWTGRLNGWIAAWNMGKSTDGRRFRGQIPVATIDADTLREFRLLIGSVIDRADDAGKAGVLWFQEERTRSRRVELLRPYNLRFHINDEGHIDLIFFHGGYANFYPQFVADLTEHDDQENWTRGIEFSRCKRLRERSAQRSVPAVTISFEK